MVRFVAQVLIVVSLTAYSATAWPSDACSTRAVNATAQVSVSDGDDFAIDSYFHSPDSAAIRHRRDKPQLVAVEGPFAWVSRGDRAELGADFFKTFALGHQFHAFLLYFDEIVPDAARDGEVLFDGEIRHTTSGSYPYGGIVRLVAGDNGERPVGMLFEFPDMDPIKVSLTDWRTIEGVDLPFRLEINDGERIFDYRYTDIDIAPHSPLWFFDAVESPGIDQVDVYRLHRTLLAAHCIGDANLVADLSTPDIIDVSQGAVRHISNAELRAQFTTVFERLRYDRYDDIVWPVIEVSPASDIAWIAADVRAFATDKQTEESFDSKWAWVMMAKKIDGTWMHAGTASSRAE